MTYPTTPIALADSIREAFANAGQTGVNAVVDQALVGFNPDCDCYYCTHTDSTHTEWAAELERTVDPCDFDQI